MKADYVAILRASDRGLIMIRDAHTAYTSLPQAFVPVQEPGWKESQLVIAATRTSGGKGPVESLFYEAMDEMIYEFQRLFLANQATPIYIIY